MSRPRVAKGETARQYVVVGLVVALREGKLNGASSEPKEVIKKALFTNIHLDEKEGNPATPGVNVERTP